MGRYLKRDHDVVFDRGYAWSGPGVFTGLFFFFPGVNLTFERHFAILSFYDDLIMSTIAVRLNAFSIVVLISAAVTVSLGLRVSEFVTPFTPIR